MHAASVYPEPGSNSLNIVYIHPSLSVYIVLFKVSSFKIKLCLFLKLLFSRVLLFLN